MRESQREIRAMRVSEGEIRAMRERRENGDEAFIFPCLVSFVFY